MKKLTYALIASLTLGGCIVLPVPDDTYSKKCEISSDRMALRVIDVAKETNTYYSISGLMLTPLLIPTTALVSGAYVAVNNVYHLGEEEVVCK